MKNPYLLALAFSVTLYLVLYFLRKLLIYQMKQIGKLENNHVDDFFVYPLAQTTQLFMCMTALYLGFQFVPRFKTYQPWAWNIYFVILMFQLGIWGKHLIKRWFREMGFRAYGRYY